MSIGNRVPDPTALGAIERAIRKVFSPTYQNSLVGQAMNVILAANPTVAAITATVSVAPSGEQPAAWLQQLSSGHYQQSLRRNLV